MNLEEGQKAWGGEGQLKPRQKCHAKLELQTCNF